MPTNITLEEMKEFDTRIKNLSNDLKSIENGFKQQFVLFLSYKDDADLVDDFEKLLNKLNKDGPQVQ